jgi:hypothetical protein
MYQHAEPDLRAFHRESIAGAPHTWRAAAVT